MEGNILIMDVSDRYALKQATHNLIVERELALDIAHLSSVPRS
ncbi:hypothetical protein [Nostoc sp.]